MKTAWSIYGAQVTAAPISEKDAKKDAKAPAKGAPAKGAPVEDKNAPKPIEIEYEQIESHPAYIVLEKDFTIQKAKAKRQEAKPAHKSSKAPSVVLTAEEKRALRLTEIQGEFEIMRSLPFSVAINMQLNKPKEEPKPEPEPEKEDRPPT